MKSDELCHKDTDDRVTVVKPVSLDISGNRGVRKYSNSELIRRSVWGVIKYFYRLSPRRFFGLRRWILRRMGAEVGARVHCYPTARIYYPWMLKIGDDSAIGEDALIYNLGLIEIGQRATISHRAHLCAGTHDYRDPALPLLRPPITIGDEAWICADAFVGPGVKIGDGAIVGARAVVMKDVEPWMVVAGNPAVPLKRRVLRDTVIDVGGR